ncbi:MAG: 5-formyltetrahydrofolate cyclo-ligase [Desulfobacterales bacterium]|nr:5-formyltetrahydrofolate cyclo-ligase [Deltaproteobacteria bacterium]MBT8373328.1 5-formyltetrahydrofolate cyclo-ligase [Deltaproteobacteria bacterium]NNK84643.1 5-formyltetrahydrofolate cyclo-ligase [Desulfobacterales bacterium]NNL41700.1 5-formyltetrahydrofolate cyclo-ligase [Desulfobacterales bacterium]
MEETLKTKSEIRSDIAAIISALSDTEIKEKTKEIENRLFDFANFLESKIALLYINNGCEVISLSIIKRCFDLYKIVVLPAPNANQFEMKLMKIDNIDKDLKPGAEGILKPDAERCKTVPIESIDIAIIPGVAFDEKGGRIGSGDGYYDRLIPKLPITTRKVALSLESQIIPQVPVESHDRHVDIIITEKRIIYKI